MANFEDNNHNSKQVNLGVEKKVLNAFRGFKKYFRLDLAVPIGQFLMGLVGFLASLYILILVYRENNSRIIRTEQAVDSLNVLIKSLNTHINEVDSLTKAKDPNVDYDTIIVPHRVIEDLKKFKTPGSQN